MIEARITFCQNFNAFYSGIKTVDFLERFLMPQNKNFLCFILLYPFLLNAVRLERSSTTSSCEFFLLNFGVPDETFTIKQKAIQRKSPIICLWGCKQKLVQKKFRHQSASCKYCPSVLPCQVHPEQTHASVFAAPVCYGRLHHRKANRLRLQSV